MERLRKQKAADEARKAELMRQVEEDKKRRAAAKAGAQPATAVSPTPAPTTGNEQLQSNNNSAFQLLTSDTSAAKPAATGASRPAPTEALLQVWESTSPSLLDELT